jgi:hypothetical protein
MTREDIKKQFPDATEEQIDALMDIHGTDMTNAKKNNVDPKVLKKLQEDSAAYAKLQEAGLTDEEKIQKALQDAKDSKIEFAKKSNRLDAEKILVGAGLTEEDYKDLIDGIVTDDAEVTKTMATNLASLISKQKDAAIQKTKEELMDGTHTPGGTGGSGDDDETDAEKVAKEIAGSQKESIKVTENILNSYL